MQYKIVYLFLLILCCVGCKKTDSPISANSSDVIWPIKIGNTWTSESTNFKVDGTVLSKQSVTNSIVGSKHVLGKDYALLNTGGFVRNDDQGAWLLREDSSREFFAFKYPGSTGDSFEKDTNELFINGKDQILPGVTRIISTDTIITVTAGQFHCYEYEDDYSSTADGKIYDKVLYFLSPNVGWIQNDEYAWDDASSTLYLMTSAKLVSKNLK